MTGLTLTSIKDAMRPERLAKLLTGTVSAVLALGCLVALAPAGDMAAEGFAEPAHRASPLHVPSIAHQGTGTLRPLPPVEPCEFLAPCELEPTALEFPPPPYEVPGMPCPRDSFFDCMELDFLVRGYFLDDQRIQWTGLEATMGAEAVFAPVIRHCSNGWETAVEGEFYINQPFDRNILVDTPERVSYAHNFDVDVLEISELFISLRRGNLLFAVGKMVTPFGRYHFPLYSNARLDAPFIRTESILWRETGLLIRYDPGWLRTDVALLNGSEDRDTNSSKALVTRIGIEQPSWGAGVSLKVQDGIGSEHQKQFNNHVGADFFVCRGPWTLSGEVIHDEYGFRHPGFDPNDVTWGRSIYYREQSYRLDEPITGLGYYLDLGYSGECWNVSLNYGEFYPQELGDPQHDVVNRRGIFKVDYQLTAHVDAYAVLMSETDGYVAQEDRLRRGGVALVGFQWVR